jgi:asparagine synthase (glutamine-hydrolysing)
MCGIIGSIGKRTEAEVAKAAQSIAHRGPDAFGIYSYKNCVLAHHRLAIIDLSPNGAQPYHFEHLSLVFNGEIYNYQSIRQELVKEGYQFISDSDTEVLIKAFHKWGVAAVSKFAGMFAFALYDKNIDGLYLFRDRIGIKPVYYSLEDGLCFCSELRGIMPLLQSKEIDTESVYEYFRVGYISEQKTIFKAARKLLPGEYLFYQNGNASLHHYWSVEEAIVQKVPQYSDKEWQEKLHEQMIASFSEHMIADVPVGVFLSGGIDSSLVTAVLQKNYGSIHSFTIGFEDDLYNEAPFARQVAKHLGTQHTEFTLRLEDAKDMLLHFYDIYDEPFADSSGIPTTIVSKLAAQAGIKVVLSADGGDELFAGYSHYFNAERFYKKIHNSFGLLKPFYSLISGGILSSGVLNNFFYKNGEHKLATLHELIQTKNPSNFYHAYLANQATAEMKKLVTEPIAEYERKVYKEGVENFMLHDFHRYLPDDLLVKADRATMYNSIEGREPFLDHRLVALAMQTPFHLKYKNGSTKWILKEILSEYIPREFYERPKKGFSIPIFNWFSANLDEMFQYYLQPEKIKATGLLNEKEVAREISKYNYFKERGTEANMEKMWRILSFMMWWERWRKPAA